MKVIAVIPARYESSRFPGKPLTDIAGKPMIQRIYEQVSLCRDIDDVLIATDDGRIFDAAVSFGARAVMTSPECRSGTDRVAQASRDLPVGAVINVQGDQVVLDRVALSEIARELKSGCPMVTVATPASPDEYGDPNCVKVVCDLKGYALYFSRAPIPSSRSGLSIQPLKHIGIYGYAMDTLQVFTCLEPTPLEVTESLEQLRALENGIPIKVIIASGEYLEINTPEDKERVLASWRES
ncbi:MAG TPA: 3-deoxy-manno-octulosonate cytidylyltransferase [Deltaproteobacteria bacterium]|nr:3-deoxy-manno-octulosonate cytidylyltransferase [Deltaproteobacteria bacterium]